LEKDDVSPRMSHQRIEISGIRSLYKISNGKNRACILNFDFNSCHIYIVFLKVNIYMTREVIKQAGSGVTEDKRQL
jgi:hypothetical protein